MNNLEKEYLLTRTKQFIMDFYETKSDNIYLWLHPDILWIGAADNQYIQGYDVVREYLANVLLSLPVCSIENVRLDVLSCDSTMCVIAGHYTGYTLPQSGQIFAACQRLTFIWKQTDQGWKIFHMHISTPLECQEESEYFPNTAGRRTYLYLQSLIEKKQKDANESALKFHGPNAATYFLYPEEISFVEADNIRCILHTAKNNLTVNQSIGSISAILPPGFVRIHRSFIINQSHAAEIKRYLIRMKDGTVLPVPEKRYKTILQQLSTEAIETPVTKKGSRT